MDRLQETGHDVILTKNKTRFFKWKTGESTSLRKDGGMFIVEMWLLVPTSRSNTKSCSGFAQQRSIFRLRTSAFRSRRHASHRRRIQKKHHELRQGHLDVDGEALEEEMDCELEDEALDIKRVRTVSDPGQPS